MRSREQIFVQLTDILEEMFEIPREDIHADADLVDDLDIDSIDAVDMLAKLKELTGLQVDPEHFKSVRKVSDVIDVIAAMEVE